MNNEFFYSTQGDFIVREVYKNSILKNRLSRGILHFVSSMFYRLYLAAYNRFYKKEIKFKHEVSICAIFKDEAMIIDEWIRYHLTCGVDHFYLYNNNSTDNYLPVLDKYIKNGLVDLYDWPMQAAQMEAYRDCYQRHKNDTHWIAYIDIDEYICPIFADNVKKWLCKFSKFPSVAVYWKQFGSNGHLKHDADKLIIEQYTQCWPKYSTFTKMFCNCEYDIFDFNNPHIIRSKLGLINMPPINQFYKFIIHGVHRQGFRRPPEIQINHYWGMAYDAFIKRKVKKTDAYHKDADLMSDTRLKLLKSHEVMCTDRDYKIQRFSLYAKLLSGNPHC